MSKYNKEYKLIKEILKYLKENENKHEPLSTEGEVYHNTIHFIVELIKNN